MEYLYFYKKLIHLHLHLHFTTSLIYIITLLYLQKIN